MELGADGLPRPIDAAPKPEKAYSPGQVGGGALLGGPLAASVLLASNFVLFDVRLRPAQTIALGVLATLAMIVLALLVPENTPNALIPAAYSLVAQQIAKRSHGDRYEAFLAAGGHRHTNWRVAGIGLLCLFALFVILLGAILLLPEDLLPADDRLAVPDPVGESA